LGFPTGGLPPLHPKTWLKINKFGSSFAIVVDEKTGPPEVVGSRPFCGQSYSALVQRKMLLAQDLCGQSCPTLVQRHKRTGEW